MQRYWFRPKRYGYGATPTTWEGWAVTAAMVSAMVAAFFCLRFTGRSYWALAALFAFDVVALATLFVVSCRRTGGEWRWRWGERADLPGRHH